MRRIIVLALLALALAGCGSPITPATLIGNAAKLGAAIASATQGYLRAWCPNAFEHGGRHLTHQQAQRCLRQARDSYLHLLKRNGYDPANIAGGR